MRSNLKFKFAAKIFFQWKLFKWIFMVFFQKNGVFLSASLSSKRTILQRCSINKTFSFRQTQTTLNHYRLWSFLLGTTAIYLEKSIRNFSKYPLLKISTYTPPFRGPRVRGILRLNSEKFQNFNFSPKIAIFEPKLQKW